MYHEDLNPKDPIKIETVIDIDSKNFKAEEAKSLSPPPPPPPPRVLTSIKRWSENKQRYFYKPKDPDYAKNHYWKTKHDMQCTVCGATVTTAMYRHVKSLRCLMVKNAVEKALGQAQIEAGETSHQSKT